MTSTRHSTCTLVRKLPTVYAGRLCLTLQRHFRVLTKFAHVESRLSGRKRQRKVVFYTPINLCDRRPCSTSVAVGLMARLDRLVTAKGIAQLGATIGRQFSYALLQGVV